MRIEAKLMAVAAVALGAAACQSEKPVRLSYDVAAGVGTVRDIANPNEPAGEYFHKNIPDLEYGDPTEELTLHLNDRFYVNCDAQRVIGPDRTPVESIGYSYEDGDETVDLRLPNTDEKVKVLLVEAEDKVNKIVVKVDGHQVDTHEASHNNGLLGIKTDLIASQFSVGQHNIECDFRTELGEQYSDTASVEIIDDRA